MDLWIMSQDKEMICKAECVELMHDDPVYAKIYLNGKFPDLIVGCYEKQRAVKVLGEIQKLLTANLCFFQDINIEPKTLQNLGIDNAIVCGTQNKKPQVEFIHRDCVVFEMPEN